MTGIKCFPYPIIVHGIWANYYQIGSKTYYIPKVSNLYVEKGFLY